MLPKLRTGITNLPHWQRTLWIMFFAQMASAVGFSMIFPFLPLYVEDLGTNTDISLEFWAGMVFSAQAITMMIVSPFWGALSDRYGRKLMVQRAMFGGTILLAMMAFARTAEELVLIRLFQGAITGTVSAANALVAASAPRERTGYAMGIIQVGLWAGVAIGPLIGGVLADAFGFRIPFLFTALLLFLAGLLVTFMVKEEFTPDKENNAKKPGFVKSIGHIVTMEGVPQTYFIRFLTSLSRSMVIPIMPLFIVFLVTNGVNEAMLLPMPPMLDGIFDGGGGVNTMTGLAVGLMSATSTFSAVLLGRIGDRIGHRKIVVGSAFAAMLAYFPQGFVMDAWQLIFLQAVTGLAIGGLVASPSALLARFTDPGEEGAVYGLDNSVVAGARSLAPLFGASLAVWFGLRVMFTSMAAVFLAIALIAIVMMPASDPVSRAQAAKAQQQPQSSEPVLLPAAGD